MLQRKDHCLLRTFDGETLRIMPWGPNALRVQAWIMEEPPVQAWALTESPEPSQPRIDIQGDTASILNGKLRIDVDEFGRLSFYKEDRLLFREILQKRVKKLSEYTNPLQLTGREFKGNINGDFRLTVRFEPEKNERLYGMGQYQQDTFDLKGSSLELAHRNAQASIPFVLSSLGYGMLWNNPAVGEAHFSTNQTIWLAHSTKILDYWIVAGDTPDDIVQRYTAVTGRAPMMPDYAMGFWQSKLRYQTQEEVLQTAREFKKRDLPLSAIVIDFFHWPHHGDWDFDYDYWPDPAQMCRELHDLGVKLMVSIWPTVEKDCVNYPAIEEKGLLVRSERGPNITHSTRGDTQFIDLTNPDARRFLWETAKKNYYDKGVDCFWLDEAEPEYNTYDFDTYRYYKGHAMQISNSYPVEFAKTFYDGLRAQGEEQVLSLVRCGWAGSQKYGALIWSGDVHSSFRALREQVVIGMQMGIAGIPWWTHDIGGFYGADVRDPAFLELFARWFAFGAFSPVFRLHGVRSPRLEPLAEKRGGMCSSGSPNEVWCFTPEIEMLCSQLIRLREALKPYIRSLMAQAHEVGRPVMRPLFYDFPHEEKLWTVNDAYMFGPDMLVAPVVMPGVTEREVLLPQGCDWIEASTLRDYPGGQTVRCPAPWSVIPVFVRKDAENLARIIHTYMPLP